MRTAQMTGGESEPMDSASSGIGRLASGIRLDRMNERIEALPENFVEDVPRLSDVLEALGVENALFEADVPLATDTRVWRVSHDGRALAVRLFREQRRGAMLAELEAIELARGSGIPVPEVVSSGQVAGRFPAMAMEWLPGDVVANIIVERPALATRLGRAAGRLLARIHRIPVEAGSSQSSLDTNWIDRLTAIDTNIRVALQQNRSERLSLLHLDFHPNNLLAVGGRLTGVLDWTNAAIGDHRLDVARTVSILRVVAPAIVGGCGARRMSLARFTRAFLRGYREDASPLDRMELFYAWAGQFLIADLSPKIDLLPVRDSGALSRSMHKWAGYWRNRALEASR